MNDRDLLKVCLRALNEIPNRRGCTLPPDVKAPVELEGGFSSYDLAAYLDRHLKAPTEDLSQMSAGAAITRWLLDNPQAAHALAFTAVAGLYLEEDYTTILPGYYSCPRSSGADYVEEVVGAIPGGLRKLLEERQAAADEDVP